MITKYCYMTTLNLKNRYYSVRIRKDIQKFLRFQWKNKLYCFRCFPAGLASCPRKFTKLNKVPVTCLDLEKTPPSGYIDDFFTKQKLLVNVKKILRKQCYFVINWCLK